MGDELLVTAPVIALELRNAEICRARARDSNRGEKLVLQVDIRLDEGLGDFGSDHRRRAEGVCEADLRHLGEFLLQGGEHRQMHVAHDAVHELVDELGIIHGVHDQVFEAVDVTSQRPGRREGEGVVVHGDARVLRPGLAEVDEVVHAACIHALELHLVDVLGAVDEVVIAVDVGAGVLVEAEFLTHVFRLEVVDVEVGDDEVEVDVLLHEQGGFRHGDRVVSVDEVIGDLAQLGDELGDEAGDRHRRVRPVREARQVADPFQHEALVLGRHAQRSFSNRDS